LLHALILCELCGLCGEEKKSISMLRRLFLNLAMKKKWAMVKITGEAKRTKRKIISNGPKIAAKT